MSSELPKNCSACEVECPWRKETRRLLEATSSVEMISSAVKGAVCEEELVKLRSQMSELRDQCQILQQKMVEAKERNDILERRVGLIEGSQHWGSNSEQDMQSEGSMGDGAEDDDDYY
ncbi:uncharacterized protein GIQ15_01634 [Arthroderma uncinatum]|uniref:uncharacterized protein n=1 Tax=Arthroderma uncinatum TaxID=74035 RepID=UPI00144AA460|nr:uncharacterized protein GIQ15_01634 [Arthroderma uncinatum]KAF3492117.1 hypothetical protein GIQ15_01634 [Arthroderma uncinatum]